MSPRALLILVLVLVAGATAWILIPPQDRAAEPAEEPRGEQVAAPQPGAAEPLEPVAPPSGDPGPSRTAVTPTADEADTGFAEPSTDPDALQVRCIDRDTEKPLPHAVVFFLDQSAMSEETMWLALTSNASIADVLTRFATRYRCDENGEVRVPFSADLALAGRHGERFVVETIWEQHPGSEVVLALYEQPKLPVQVVDAAGTPQPNASVVLREVTRVPVDAEGRADSEALLAALRDDTCLVVLILANNETGVLQDVAAVGAALGARGVPLHVDATQAVGKIPVDVAQLGAATLSGSAHKFGGPKGSGFLIERDESLEPWIRGGPQERRRRGGTENSAGIVGLGVACALASRELPDRMERYAALRDRLWEGIRKGIRDVRRNGSPVHVLPNTLNLEFCGAAGEVLLEALDGEGVSVSAGAACASGSIEPSPVLSAMGRSPEQARGSLRFSVGHGNDTAQIDRVVAMLPELVARVRKLAS